GVDLERRVMSLVPRVACRVLQRADRDENLGRYFSLQATRVRHFLPHRFRGELVLTPVVAGVVAVLAKIDIQGEEQAQTRSRIASAGELAAKLGADTLGP